LNQDCVHWFLITCWVFFLNFINRKDIRSLRLNKSSNLRNNLSARLSCAWTCSRLNRENWFQHIVCWVLGVCYLRIIVQSKCLWRRIQWKLLNVFDKLIKIICWRLFVYSWFWESVALLQDSFINVNFNDGSNKSNVFIISDSTSIVYFRSQKV